MLHIAKDIASGETPQTLTERHRTLDNHLANELIFDRESKLQRLLHAHDPEDWPAATAVSDLIQGFAAQSASRALLPPGERMNEATVAIICLPILLAYGCATNALPPRLDDPGTRNDIHRYQDFDPDWFTEAFNHTITRCVSRGLLTVAPV